MKTVLKAGLLLASMLWIGVQSFAQVSPPPPPGGPQGMTPPPPGGPGRRGPGRPLQQLTTVSGTLAGYLNNDRYEYDGFMLQNSGQTVTVRFPAHLGEQVMRVAKKGAAVTVQGFYETSPEGANEFHLVSLQSGGATMTDIPPIPPATPPVEQPENFAGTISDLRKNREGMMDGIILGSNKVVDLPPATAEQLTALLRPGESVSGSGVRVVRPVGVVTVRATETIRPQTLTVNGQTYLVR